MRKRKRQKFQKQSDYESAGTFEYLPIDLLKIDPSYQRDPLNDREIRRIATDFDWNAFGTLLVMRRASGALFVVDGQQRMQAAIMIGAIHVPCFVFESRGARHEAIEFLRTNTRRRAVSAIDKFAAAVLAQKEPEITIKNWLDDQGIVVTRAPVEQSIGFVSQLIKLWQRNPDACKRAIATQLAIVESEPLSARVDGGLWWLENGKVITSPHIKKMRIAGGITGMRAAIAKLKIELHGGGTPSEKIAGVAILRLINKGKRKKVGLHLLQV